MYKTPPSSPREQPDAPNNDGEKRGRRQPPGNYALPAPAPAPAPDPAPAHN